MKKRTILTLIIISFFILIGLSQLTTTKKGHLTLLTVTTDDTMRGGTADLYLDIRPGTGNVYIATFPFTQLDTQISTRFAKEVACDFTNKDCDNYDFFYTIRADSTIVGGPSAGGAISALTAALLDNQPIKQGVAMTGTINSGGIIGPVAGINEKIRAAEQAGMNTVIIPQWHITTNNNTNTTEENTNYTVTIKKVATLAEALTIITGKNYTPQEQELTIPPAYKELMATIADQLCQRSETIKKLIPPSVTNHTLMNKSAAYLSSAAKAQEQGLDYSRASFCFSANLRLRELQLSTFTKERLRALAQEINNSITAREEELNTIQLQTITDLQTKAIVDERLKEARTYLETTNLTPQAVAYALERYHSAITWSAFFSLPGQPLQLDEQHLQTSCEEKLAEVEERVSYLKLLIGDILEENTELENAYEHYNNGDYALCLFKASKAKAEIDIIISTASVPPEEFSSFIKEKLRLTKNIIIREEARGRFPLMGYSYYEYAGVLSEEDPYLSALFAAYSLELSDLSRYFPQQRSLAEKTIPYLTHPFTKGLITGLLITLIIILFSQPKNAHQKKRTR